MGKKYVTVPNEKRRQIIDLIYNKGMTIAQASKEANIFYATAKAINNVYYKSGRQDKKAKRVKKRPRRTVLTKNTILQMPFGFEVEEQKEKFPPNNHDHSDSQGVIALFEANNLRSIASFPFPT